MENINTFSATDMMSFAVWAGYIDRSLKIDDLKRWVDEGCSMHPDIHRIKDAIEAMYPQNPSAPAHEESPWAKRMKESVNASYEERLKRLADLGACIDQIKDKHGSVACNELTYDPDPRVHAFSDEQLEKWEPQVFKAICDNPDEILRQFINYAVVCLGSGIALRPDELKTFMKIAKYFNRQEASRDIRPQ